MKTMFTITKAIHSALSRTTRIRLGNAFLAVVISCALFAGPAESAGTINTYFSSSAPASLMADFLASTTNQYLGSLVPSPYFANTYSLTLSGKNPNYFPPVVPAPSTPTVNATQLLQALVDVSTSTYIYGWADGVDNERKRDTGFINNFLVNCSSAPYFKAPVAGWSISVCTTTLATAYNFIYQQSFSTPIAPPGQ